MKFGVKYLYIAVASILGPITAYAATSVTFTVSLSEAVTVDTTGGTPRISVDVGGVTRYASYTSGTGTSSLIFTYDAVVGDVDLDGVALSSPIQLNGGTIKDIGGNDTTLTFTPPNTSNVNVNYPSLGMDFIVDADGRYTLNGTIYNNLPSFLTATGGTFSRTSIGTYFDSSGILQTAAAGQPRFDYNPVTLQPRGILIEESRSNSILNSEMSGAVIGTIGSGGSMPTTWLWGIGTASLTRQIIASGTLSNGMKYMDVRLSGTNSSGITVYPDIYPTVTASCPAATIGQTWTTSAYVAVIAGSMSGFVSNPLRFSMSEINSGGTFLTGGAVPISGGAVLTKYSYTRTLTNASTARACPYYDFSIPNGGTVDLTLRIAIPQMEQGALPTSYIPTTTAAVTRAKDSLIIPAGSWYNSGLGTLTTQSVIPFIGGASLPGTASLDNGGANDSISLFMFDSSGDQKTSQINSGGVFTFSSAGAAYIAGNVLRQGLYYETNAARTSMDGVLGTLDTSVTVPTVTMLRIGDARGGISPLDGWVQKTKYYPARVSNTQLQLITQ